MNSIKVLIFSIFFLGTVISFSSCEEDPCENIVCLNGGVCLDGTCTDCNIGYEDELCSTLSRAKMLGDYTVSFSDVSSTYPATISPHATDDLRFLIDYVDNGANVQWELIMTGEFSFNVAAKEIFPGSGNATGNGVNDSNSGVITVTSNWYIMTLTP